MNQGFRPAMKAIQPGDTIPIDLKNATPKECPCGSKYFISAFLAFTVSALASPVGKEMVVQTPVLVCLECKKPL